MEDGFEQFVAGQSARLLRMAYLLTGDRGHAEDLMQEALYRTYRHWKRVGAYDRPEFYVRKAMLRMQGRTVSRRRGVEDPVPSLPEGAAPDHQGGHAERDELWTALRALPPRTRAVVVLRYWDDRSEAETAELLDISVGTVKSQASRGLAALRGLLHDQQRAGGSR